VKAGVSSRRAARARVPLALALVVAAAGVGAADDSVKLGPALGNALGRPGAPLVLIEFTDLECAHCRQFQQEVFPRLKKEYVDTGQVLFIHRDLPLAKHPHAMAAARAARCADEQGRFWELREALLLASDRMSARTILDAAEAQRLDMTELLGCLLGDRYVDAVRKDTQEAANAGIRVTPTVVIGRIGADGVEGVKLEGALPYEAYDSRLRELLRPGPSR
jgi:protein-disulfide isomerase